MSHSDDSSIDDDDYKSAERVPSSLLNSFATSDRLSEIDSDNENKRDDIHLQLKQLQRKVATQTFYEKFGDKGMSLLKEYDSQSNRKQAER
jgi:uncharacterized protein YcgL (UPF0745 family)